MGKGFGIVGVSDLEVLCSELGRVGVRGCLGSLGVCGFLCLEFGI